MNRIKQALKEPLIQKQNMVYEYLLDKQSVLYQDWITRIEIQEKERLCTDQEKLPSCRVIEYKDCTDDLDTKSIKEEIVVFTSDCMGLASDALLQIQNAFFANKECMLVYGDEDEWNVNGTIRMNPWFKPDWSPDYLLSYFYFGNVFAIRKNLLQKKECFHSKNGLKNLYAFVLSVSLGKTKQNIFHIHHVLFHSHNLQMLCKEKEYDEIRENAVNQLKTENSRTDNPCVSIIVPSKDNPAIVENLFQSIVEFTTDVEYELILVDNGSSKENRETLNNLQQKYPFQYIYKEQPFNFSKMCNLGAENAKGGYLLFLNDDVKVQQTKWLSAMLEKAKLNYVGAVGAKLYYPESKMIQHAGITNLRLGPVHKLQFKEDSRGYYYDRNLCVINVLAVTGACMMVNKRVFDKVHGFDETLSVAFNDVDLCFRLYEAGYVNVQRNDIHLWHYESLSRGNDEAYEKQIRLASERELLYQKHPGLYAKDPYYHPYLNNDILDTNFSYAYQYESGRNVTQILPRVYKGKLKDKWRNECLQISIEYAGVLEKWIHPEDKQADGFYLQGYSFVMGSDNSCYQKFLLLQEKEKNIIYQIPFNEVYRPDLEMNLDSEEKTLLCGFSIAFDRKDLKEGDYRIGVLAKDRCSRQRLYRFTQKYIKV